SDGDKVVGPPRLKNAIGRAKGDESRVRQAGGNGNQILFRHAHIEKAVGECFPEGKDIGVFPQVGGEPHHVVSDSPHLHQGFAKRGMDGWPFPERAGFAHSQGLTWLNHGPSPIVAWPLPTPPAPTAQSAPFLCARSTARLCLEPCAPRPLSVCRFWFGQGRKPRQSPPRCCHRSPEHPTRRRSTFRQSVPRREPGDRPPEYCCSQ